MKQSSGKLKFLRRAVILLAIIVSIMVAMLPKNNFTKTIEITPVSSEGTK